MLVDPSPRRLVGQLVPAAATTVRLESTSERRAGVRPVRALHVRPRATGPVRIGIAGSGGRPVTTDWVLL